MQNRNNIAKVIDFKLDRKEGPVDFQTIQIHGKLFLIQIQALAVRRFVHDAIATALSGYNLTKEELFIRDSFYIQHNVNEYVATIKLLACDGSIEQKTYGWKRTFSFDLVVFKSLINRRQPGQWKSCLEWSNEDFKTQNTSGFVYTPDNLYPPLLYIEIEKTAPHLIPDILDYKGQAILICENIGNIATCLSAVERRGKKI